MRPDKRGSAASTTTLVVFALPGYLARIDRRQLRCAGTNADRLDKRFRNSNRTALAFFL